MDQEDHTAPVPTDVARRTRVLASRYLLEERIASGGMAAVWRAHDETLARTVAIKILHEHLAADADLQERFRREAVAAAKLGHPGLVGIYDTGEEDRRTYLVMEYVEGETLRTLMEGQRLDLGHAAAIGHQVAQALSYAHERHLVHRDIKPANILISSDGTVKVADFGIAKAAQAARDLTQTGMVLGTAAYVSPEQVRGEPVDGAADQYALGCVLYEAMTGRRPFESESTMTMATARLEQDPLPLRSLRPDVPRVLDDVVMRSLAREPNDRHPDMRAFADALSEWVGEKDADTDELPDDLPIDDASGKPSFFRSEGTWIASVLAIVTVAATLMAIGLGTGVLESEQIPQLTASDQEAESESPGGDEVAAANLEADDLRAFDPPEWGGDGEENDDQLPNLLDGDPGTAWHTETYDDVTFGSLKPGVGFVADLGRPHSLRELRVTPATAGVSFEVYASEEVSTDLDDWTLAGSRRDLTEAAEVSLNGTEGRYVLVLLVPDLPMVDGTRGAGGFSTLEVRGVPQ